MTAQEFNEKYKAYIEKGFEYGPLEFDVPEATEFLDKVFTDLILIPNFTFAQIKVKFNSVRFYSTLKGNLGHLIEKELKQILKL